MRAGHAITRGFTLIEIMVVVFIIGLVTAGAIIKFSGERRDTELEHEADRLDALFGYVREQAELQTRDYGFRATETEFTFVVFDVLANQWRPVDEDEALRKREFPEGIQPGVVVEGRPIVLNEKREVEDFTPQILIFANGDLSSFEVSLKRADTDIQARIFTDEQNGIRLLQPGQKDSISAATRTVQRQ